MKMKFKFGNTKIKVSWDDKSEGRNYNDNPFEVMFSEADLDFLNKTYKKLSANVYSYYQDVNKVFEKYVNKPNRENEAGTPGTLPANGHDIYNYVARYGVGNFQIQTIIQLDGRLDFGKLSKAVRLSLEAEPVFGCRFIENDPPYWRRLADIHKIKFCSMEETDNPDKAVQRFIESPLDMDRDPMVKVKLIRSGTCDILGIKVNHSCCDGTGAKEYLRLLSDIYSCIDSETGVFVPNPGIRSRKDQDRLFSELGLADPETAWIPGSEITRATWAFPWKSCQSWDTARVVVCRLPQGALEEMISYGKVRGATINDLILTAFYRAMLEMGQPIYCEPMEIPVTVDLRRYLPDHKTEAIRNFSGSVTTSLTMAANESFAETLSRVIPLMNQIKSQYPGLQSAIGLERVEKLTWNETVSYFKMMSQYPSSCANKCAPVLSNVGLVSKDLLKFGGNTVTDAYVVPPVVRAPGFLLMTSSYNGILTLVAGYYEQTASRKDIERLLGKVRDELTEGCK